MVGTMKAMDKKFKRDSLEFEKVMQEAVNIKFIDIMIDEMEKMQKDIAVMDTVCMGKCKND